MLENTWKFFRVYSLWLNVKRNAYSSSVQERSNSASNRLCNLEPHLNPPHWVHSVSEARTKCSTLTRQLCVPRNHPYTHWHAQLRNQWAWALGPGAWRVKLEGYYGMRGILLRSSANLPEHVLLGNSALLTLFPFNHSGRKKKQAKNSWVGCHWRMSQRKDN